MEVIKINIQETHQCSLSNNASENRIRPLFVVRKSFLLSDVQDGANASMMVYTIIETAKANGLDPSKYITHTLKLGDYFESVARTGFKTVCLEISEYFE